MDVQRYFASHPGWKYENFRQMLDGTVRLYGDKTAFRSRPQGAEGGYSTLTFTQVGERANVLSRFFLSSGLTVGDSVAIFSENRPEWCICYFAVVICGLVVVPLDAALDERSVANILSASSARGLIFSERMGDRARAAVRACSIPDLLLLNLDTPAPDASETSYREILEAPRATDLPNPSSLSGDAPASIIFTSGTTGIAKGIVLSHRGILSNMEAALRALRVNRDDTLISVLPLHHTYATTCTFLAPLETGASVTFVEKIIPTVVLRHILESKVTVLIGVPLLFDKIRSGIESELRKLPKPASGTVRLLISISRFFALTLNLNAGRSLLGFLRRKAGIDSLRMCVSGGGPLLSETACFFDALGLGMVQGYGMSENGPLISVNLPQYKDNRSVGLAVWNTQVRIADAGRDGNGEIQVRSPSLMKGYLNNSEATSRVVTEDGWLRTGDLGHIDPRGFIFVTGRSKDLIVTEGGKNVYPEEIEQRFADSRWISEILILGRKSGVGNSGEDVVALCFPNYEAIKSERPEGEKDAAFVSGLIRSEVHRINKGLPQYMKIVDFSVRETEFEKTSTRKIKRFLYKDSNGSGLSVR